MAQIQFSNGKTVEFNGNPTPADVEQVASLMGIHDSSQSIQTVKPKTDYLQKASDIVSTVFPGKQVGDAIGTAFAAGKEALKGNTKGAYDIAATAPTPLQVAGDVAQGALTVAAPGVTGETAGARIGANAALGVGIGATGAIAKGASAGDVVTSGLVGGTIGGAVSGIGELLNSLPNWFTKKALPKLNPENVDFAKQTLSAGSVKSNLVKSSQAVKSSGNVIDSILNHPQYTEEVGNIQSIIPSVKDALPNAGLDDKAVLDTIKSLAPKNATLVDKLAKGTANIAEQNTLRQELDKAIYPNIADKINPKLSFDKSVGKIVTDAIRNNVQSTAPETAPLFEQFSKEINLNNALKFAKAKIEKGAPVSLYDLGGYGVGGVPGLIGERVARTPAALITAAKAISGSTPAVAGASKALKAPVLNSVTSSLNKKRK